MKSENIKKIAISIFILLSIFLLDRVSKILILNILEETGRVDIYINSFLNFYLVWNKGIGFGLLSSDQDYFYNLGQKSLEQLCNIFYQINYLMSLPK